MGSNDLGTTWQYYSFRVSAKGLIPWDIEEDPVNKKIYVATEIYNHPTPYDPPFLLSSDGGITWDDISGSSLLWHAVKIQVQPKTRNVYVLLEGPGLYRSADFGAHWEKLGDPFGLQFIIDKNNPQVIYGGAIVYGIWTGGAFQSNDGGKTFTPKALQGHIVNSLCLNSNSNYLYVASYKSGLYRIKIK